MTGTERLLQSDRGAEILAAIDRGIKAADKVRVISLEEVRKMIPVWIRKFESREKR